jgi:hypothetical protein
MSSVAPSRLLAAKAVLTARLAELSPASAEVVTADRQLGDPA